MRHLFLLTSLSAALTGTAGAEPFDRPITGTAQVGVHPFKVGPDAVYVLKVEGKTTRPDFGHPFDTFYDSKSLRTDPGNVRQLVFHPTKEQDCHFVVFGDFVQSARAQDYTLTLLRAPLAAEPIFKDQGEFGKPPSKSYPLALKAERYYLAELLPADKEADCKLELLEVKGKKGNAVLLSQLGVIGQGTQGRRAFFIFKPDKDGDYQVQRASGLSRGGFTLTVREQAKPGAPEPVGEPVPGRFQGGAHKFACAPDAVFVVKVVGKGGKPELDLEGADLNRGTDLLDLPNPPEATFCPLRDQECTVSIRAAPFVAKPPAGPLEYTLIVERRPLAAKAVLEVKGEITAADPVYADSHYKGHDLDLKADRYYVIDMIKEAKELKPYPFVEDLTKPQTSSLKNIVAGRMDGLGNQGARIIFRPAKDGKYRLLARSLGPQLGAYRIVVRESSAK